MQEKILSIIVPSYNAAKFLPETIPTMVNVKNPELLEVIIVNDGSRDNTQEVALELQKKYPNIIEIINKVNGGHGSTINAGIKVAKGKYFKVIDADDWADTTNLSELIIYLKTCDDDQVISPFIEFYMEENKEIVREYVPNNARESYNYSDYIHEINQLPAMHSITIKTKILRENNITLDENCFYVDLEYNVFPIPYLKTISYFEKVVYRYRLGREGQSVSMESFIKNIHMLKKVIIALIVFYNKNLKTLNEVVKIQIKKLIIFQIWMYTKVYLSMPYSKENKKQYVEFEYELKNLNKDFSEISHGKRQWLLRKSKYTLFKYLMFNRRF